METINVATRLAPAQLPSDLFDLIRKAARFPAWRELAIGHKVFVVPRMNLQIQVRSSLRVVIIELKGNGMPVAKTYAKTREVGHCAYLHDE